MQFKRLAEWTIVKKRTLSTKLPSLSDFILKKCQLTQYRSGR